MGSESACNVFFHDQQQHQHQSLSSRIIDNNYHYSENRGISTVTSCASSTRSNSSSSSNCSRHSSNSDGSRNNGWSYQPNNLSRSVYSKTPSLSPKMHQNHHNQNNQQQIHTQQQSQHQQQSQQSQHHHQQNYHQHEEHEEEQQHPQTTNSDDGHENSNNNNSSSSSRSLSSFQRNDWNTLVPMSQIYQRSYIDSPYSIESGNAHPTHLQNSSNHVYKRYFQTGIIKFFLLYKMHCYSYV